jgi:hypothetical protein
MTMKKLLPSIALAATVVSFPALAEVGCEQANSLNDTKVSNCDNNLSGYVMSAPSPWYGSSYGSGAYIGYGSYAYVPQRRFDVRTPIHDDLDNETRLKGGAD